LKKGLGDAEGEVVKLSSRIKIHLLFFYWPGKILISSGMKGWAGASSFNIIIMSKLQDEKLPLDEEINVIFKSVYQRNINLRPKVPSPLLRPSPRSASS
jgi:hypothetical protein